jgi:hypothetical protein
MMARWLGEMCGPAAQGVRTGVEKCGRGGACSRAH